jgi:hypothetical protein
MPEEAVSLGTESPGWIAGLPADLKGNEAFTKFKTVGDFAKSHLELSTKATELEKKAGNSIPKLPDDANDEERSLYFDALGRPKDAKEYEFEGEDKNATEWTSKWKQRFHAQGLTKAQASAISKEFNGEMQAMVDAHNTKLQNEYKTAETALKSEWGDKFDTNVELAKRVYQKLNLSEFDKDFSSGTDTTRLSTIKLLMKVAAATGEDRSPQARQSQGGNGKSAFITYDKSPAPPKK